MPRSTTEWFRQLACFLVFLLCIQTLQSAGFAQEPQLAQRRVLRPESTVSAPTFSPAAGTYTSSQSVTISTSTSGASIRYTTDGSTPSTTAGTLYTGPVAVSVTTTIKAIAYKSGMTTSGVSSAPYTIVVADPTFSPVQGTYTSAQNVAISTSTSGASIRYTTDGSTPSPTVGTLYSTSIAVSSATTIKAIAYKTGLSNSNVVTATYTIAVADPTFSPVQGTYTSAQSVAISTSTAGASIRYSTDGSTPSTTAGTLYSTPIAVSVTTTIKAIAYKTGLSNSNVVPATYTIAVADPTLTPGTGRYTSSQNVAIATTTSGASIRYSTDGSTPSTTAGTLYSAPVAVSGSTTTIKAIAYKTGLSNSNVVPATYTIAVADPTLTPGTGSYGPTLTVTIATATSGASIRYTTDGSAPSSTAGTVYSSPVPVTSTKTIKAIAYKTGLANSNVVPATYTILPQAATPTFTPATGRYSSPQTIKIATTTSGASINYTTDGSTPTESVGTLYTAPFLLTQTATVQAIAYKSGMADSAVGSATYTITSPDFSLGAIPSRQQVAQGGTASFTITTTAVNGFNQSVALSAGSPPSGVTIGFNPSSITGAGGAAMNVSVSGSTAAGSYPLVVTGVGGGLTHTETVTLVVLAPTFYEAEATANQLAGGAAVVACSSCSGGYRVDNLGYTGSSANGTLTFPNINAATSGIYALTVYFTNGNIATRTANISVNGSTSTLSISGETTGSWTTVNTVSVNVTLAAGNNTIEFFNNAAPAPAIDRISLVNTESCSATTVDVVLTIDRSGSMGGLPLSGVQTAAEAFVDDLQLSSDQVALVSFNSTASTNQTLTHTGSLVKTAIAALTSSGSTAIATGITAASTELASARHNAAAQKVIVLLSDGVDNPASGATATTTAANTAKAAGIRIISIAYGTANTTFMQSLASSSTDYYASPTAAQMTAVYNSIAASICRSPNQPPAVDAGPNQTVTLPATATLTGAVSDDGLPQGNPLTATWSKVSGPGTVSFANPNAPATTATFSAAGTYVLQLSASDGQLTSTDTVTITAMATPTPAVTAILPTSGQQGQTLTGVQITGQSTHFGASSTVSFGNPGVTATSVSVTDATHLTATVTLSPTAALGATSVTVTTPAATETATAPSLFTVTPGAVVTAILPTSGQQGQTLTGVQITGQNTHFGASSTVSFGNPGVTATSVSVTDATHLTATVTLSPTAALGTTSVTVTTGSEVATGSNLFTVTAPITVTVSPANVVLASGQTQQFTASLTNTTNQSVTWSTIPSGVGSFDGTGLYTAPSPVTAQQSITITATSVADTTKSGGVPLTLMPMNPSAFLPIRVNAGGPAYTDPQGRFWSASFGFSAIGSGNAPGPTSVTPAVGSNLPFIYQSAMAGYGYDPFQFQTFVPNMQYVVTLKFADPWNDGVGGRVFDVSINGVDVLPGVDVFKNAGGQGLPWDATVPVDVTNGQITIGFGSWSFINAIEILPADSVEIRPSSPSLGAQQTLQFTASVQGVGNQSVTWGISPSIGNITTNGGLYGAPSSVAATTSVTVTATSVANPNLSGSTLLTLVPTQASAFSPFRVNAGGPAYTDPQGRFWSASFGFSAIGSGNPPGPTSVTPAVGSNLPFIYQSAMAGWGADPFQFQTFVPNMQYLVTLKFADPWNSGVGGRVYDVSINGVDVLPGVDVFKNAGGQGLPWDATVPVDVTNGQISIRFGGWGYINAIEILAVGTVQVLPSSVYLWASQQQQFLTEVADPVNPGVTWAPVAAGAITNTGLYTAPAAISAPQQVTVTATDAGTPAWSGAATVNLFPPGSIAVFPASVTLRSGQTWQFAVLTSSGPATGVVWTLSPTGFGTIDSSGLYTAPAIYTPQTVTLTATFNGATATATILLQPTVTLTVGPATATLGPSQVQQFTATVQGTWNTGVTWTLSPAGTGFFTTTGLYTAPSTISSVATVQITATSAADSSAIGIATVTLTPTASSSVTISPSTATLSAYQSQQFQAAINGTPSTAVTWSVAPSGMGNISSTGLYTAPANDTPQTVTVTATSVADPTQTATAIVTLTPSVAAGYRYRRPIVIDHTKVPNTDQVNFPVLISGTYSYLANVASGGKVQNANGYDIVFTSDCGGDQKLAHEIESYRASDGTVAMWVRIPYVSHTVDTVFYMSYGDSSITSSQENKAGVWDGNYQMVLHLGESAAPYQDSTANAYSSTGGVPPAPAAGKIGGAQSFDGVAQYIAYSQAQSPNPTTAISMEAWVKTTDTAAKGVLGKWLNDGSLNGDQSYLMFYRAGGQPSGLLNSSGFGLEVDAATAINDGNWHHLAVTAPSSGSVYLYVDGAPRGSLDTSGMRLDATADRLLIGATGLATGAKYMNGAIDEVRISNSARTGDWIAAEYNNQNSPATFYSIYPENSTFVAPANAALSSSQSQQFTAVFSANGGAASQLTFLGAVQTPSAAESLVVNGNLAYLCDYNEVSVIDVTNPSQPGFLGEATSASIVNDGFAYCAIQRGSLVAFVDATGTSIGNNPSFVAFDLTNPAQPQVVKGTPVDKRFFSNKPEYVGNTAFLSTYSWNFVIGGTWVNQHGDIVAVDVSDFSNPTVAGTLSSGGDSVYGGPNPIFGVTVLNQQTALAGSTTSAGTTNGVGNLLVVDISNPAAMSTVAQVPVPGTVYVYKPLVQGNLAIAAGDSGGYCGGGECPIPSLVLTTFDITNPRNPAILASLTTPFLGGGTATTAAPIPIGANLVLFAGARDSAGNNVLLLVDTSDPLHLRLSSFMVPVPITRMAVVGDVLHTSAGPGGYAAFRIPGLTSGQYAAGSCSTPATWTLNPPGVGSITPDGVYTAPAGISSQQTVTVTATNPSDPTQTYSSTVTLWPGLLTTLTAVTPAPYAVGSSATFQATVTNLGGTPMPGVNLTFNVTGANVQSSAAVTNSSGQATFTYTGTAAGTDLVQTSAGSGSMSVVSNLLSVSWGLPTGPLPTIQVGAYSSIALPSPLLLSATVTDPAAPQGGAISVLWSQVSGPGTVTFADPTQTSTAATFSQPGVYVLQITATDLFGSITLQLNSPPITVNKQVALTQGWIGTPLDQSTVTGVVPITLALGVSLASGTLSYSPTTDITQVHVLNANTTGTGQIGVLDTTLLANGSYWVELYATDSNGNTQNNLAMVKVVGDYKPGRVTATVTDLVVPAPGLSIPIQRTYDSLVRSTSSDFGYGWTLGVNVQLEVSPSNDVTLTLNGQRRTFYFTPYVPGFDSLPGIFVPNLLTVYFPAYTAEAGMYGKLSVWNGGSALPGSNSGCALDWMVQVSNTYYCYDNAGIYQPGGYIYTDPYGRQYTIAANGGLQSIKDLQGNTLTVTPNGIMASNGLSVPFVRDTQGRITQITDTLGNNYVYTYDDAGNLWKVAYPGVATPAAYTYNTDHYYTGGTDPRSNPLPSVVYADGRLQSVTDALNQTTSYAYDLTTNTTTVTNPDGGIQTTQYDAYGKVLSVIDPLGHTTTNVYDANHNLISTTDPLGHTTSYTYDSNGNKLSQTYPKTATSANTTSFTVYNQYSEPTGTRDELGNVVAYGYDANLNPSLMIDYLNGTPTVKASFVFNPDATMQAGAIGYDITASPGNLAQYATQYAYDANGNMAGKTDALGRQTLYTYDAQGKKRQQTDPSGGITTFQYDPLGNLTGTSAPLGRATSSQYDANGNKTSDTDANGLTTTYQYDALNRLWVTTYPTPPPNNTTILTYDFRNNVVNATDQAGNVTHNDYDLAGRLIAVTKAYGATNASKTTYTYYDDGRRHTQTDPALNTTTYTYDAAGRLLTVTDAASNQTQYGYDDAGNQISTTDAKGHKTQFQYDCRKRLIKTIYPDLTYSTNTYDGPGNLTGVTDQAGKTVQYTFDVANQLKSVIQVSHPDPAHNTTAYGYDSNGNLTASTDANGHSTATVFDVLNELTSTTLPDGALTERRAYDLAGNLHTLLDFNSKTTTYAYDPLNRLLSRTPDQSLGDPVESFTYTPTGKRATMTDASALTTYAYDDLDRLQSKATQHGTLSYTYDAAGNVASMTSSNPNGISVAYAYDQLNRLATVTDNRLAAGQNTTTYTYDPASNLATATYPNGQQSTFGYDTLNRLTAMNGYAYQLDAAGNRKQATEPSGRTANWSYDGIYRLTNEAISLDPHAKNGSVGYSLDPVGNRLSQNSTLSGIPSATFSYDADDRILSTEQYDNNGNTIVSGARTFAYDFENRLKSMNNGAVTLVYDGDGNRVGKTVGGSTTQYLVDDLNPTGYAQVVEELTNGAVTRSYTYGLQRISQTQSAGTSFYGYDGFGSVRQLTDITGAVTDTYDYDAWGNAVNVTGSTPNVCLYRGEQYDPDLHLYYFRARYFNPLTGRFLTRDTEPGDTLDPTTLHKYLYSAADPVNLIDPTGHGFLDESFVVGGTLPAYPILGQLTAGAAAVASQIAAWAGAGFVEAGSILASLWNVAKAGGIVKTIACVTIGFGIGKSIGKWSDAQKYSVALVFSYVCAKFMPFPGPPPFN